jgi:filamentous hemagglutinin
LGLSGDLRGQYLGRTPGKYSATGRKVFDRMRADGLIVGNGPLVRGNANRLWVVAGDGVPYFIDHTVDMAHLIDAVSWWNNVGRFYGPKSKEVRAFMLNPDHYVLEPQSINRSLGAQLRENYLPPSPQLEILHNTMLGHVRSYEIHCLK